MAHALTEADAFTGSVTVPDGGDARTAASVETPFQALTNRTNYMLLRALGVKTESFLGVALNPILAVGFGVGNGPGGGIGQVQNTINGSVVIPLPVFDPILKLKSLTVKYRAATGHGALPGSQPAVSAVRIATDGASSALGTLTQDAAGSVAAYEAAAGRTLVLAGLPHTYVANNNYYVVFAGEGVSNFITGLHLISIVIGVGP
jgi:hypothetical protein